jgi:hypothetical protein
LSFALVVFFLALAVIVFPQRPAAAAASRAEVARVDLCTIEEWQNDIPGCVSRLRDVATERTQCLKAPTPAAPDSGFAGWFASRPESSRHSGATGLYSQYGYAGYAYTTYDIGCASTLMHPDYKFENTVPMASSCCPRPWSALRTRSGNGRGTHT